MTFATDRQPPKGRGINRKPTKAEIKQAWDRIRSAAAGGDLQASALLIALFESKPLFAALESRQ